MSLTPLQWFMLGFSAFNTLLAYGAFADALNLSMTGATLVVLGACASRAVVKTGLKPPDLLKR